jgi:GDP-mannose 6-dehydrogenase
MTGKRVSVFGLGYVGTVLLGCLAREGHRLIGVDVDSDKLRLFRSGRSPILEDGIQELIEEGIRNNKIEFTESTEYAIANSEISFTCVGTPSRENGSQDLSALERVAVAFGEAMRKNSAHHVFVIRSTSYPGTIEEHILPAIERCSGKRLGEHFSLCFQPEFLREGSSVQDYFRPPFTVVGGNSSEAVAKVKELFEGLPGEFIETDIRTAEMLKYCCNAFHALKITFANEIGRICNTVGVDSLKVMDLVCRDRTLNISPTYLRPGFAFGGSCLPKDLRALTYMAIKNDVSIPMLSHVLDSNNDHIDHAIQMILRRKIRSIGMVGLSFKKGTDDLRESPMVVMAERFIGKGLKLIVYDPMVHLSRLIGANRRYIETSIPHIASLMCQDPEHLIRQSSAIIVGQRDDNFLECLYRSHREDQFVLDLEGQVDASRLGCVYEGACWSRRPRSRKNGVRRNQ